ncbi:MAG: CBM9 family sugar-binding protein [Sinobacterium sp.]
MLRTFLFSIVFCGAQISATEVKHTATPIVVDGVAEQAWDKAQWQPMIYLMSGSRPKVADFSGRYKLLWDNQYLYLQAQIIDDVLFDKTADPTVKYWDDDCLEVFIDSDASGGNHQYNHSAFAYHIALDNQTVDIGDDQKAHVYNEHITSRWQRDKTQHTKIIWEVAIKLFPDNYSDTQPLPSITLKPEQKIGFMLAYCDNDASATREHFMGSHKIEPVNGDTNRGWIDANVFSKFNLKK